MLKFSALFALLMAVSLPAMAEESVVSVASPKCDAGTIKKLSAGAIKSVEAAEWDGGYRVTLDTAALSAADLNQKLMDAGCF